MQTLFSSVKYKVEQLFNFFVAPPAAMPSRFGCASLSCRSYAPTRSAAKPAPPLAQQILKK
jgi:hypothetical protein